VNRIRGLWYSEANIDENNLILYRFDKRKATQHNKRPKVFPKPKPPAPAPTYKPGITPPKAKVSYVPPNSMQANSALPQGTGQSYDTMFKQALEKHKLDTVELLKQSAANGEKSVSISAIGEARKENVAVMRRANTLGSNDGDKHRTEQEITAALSKAEGDAVQMYIVEARKKKT
jgi:hypothetical protein